MPQTPEGVTDSERGSDGLPEAIILDVGHGNAAVFLDAGQALVVDAGPGDLVAGTLVDHDALEIVGLVISHRHHRPHVRTAVAPFKSRAHGPALVLERGPQPQSDDEV